MQIVAAARSVYVQEFADHVQAVEQAGSHRQRINVRKRYAAARDLRVRKALGARNNQRESGKRAAKRVFFIDGTPAAEEVGELLLTDYGVSGVCVFQLSREVAPALAQKRDVRLSINFLPSENVPAPPSPNCTLEDGEKASAPRDQ